MTSARKKVLHVNQHVIRDNHKTGARNPVITVKCGRKNIYGHEVAFNGPARIVYSPDKPLSCGARVWIETAADVTVRTDTGVEIV